MCVSVQYANEEKMNSILMMLLSGHQATLYIIHWFRELPSQQMRTFSRYLITLLVIFYFQSKGKLPPIVKLEKDTNIKCGGMTENCTRNLYIK